MKTLWASRDRGNDVEVRLFFAMPVKIKRAGIVHWNGRVAGTIHVFDWPGPPIAPGECVEVKIVRADAEIIRLRESLDAAHKNDWTGSLCDRLNQIARHLNLPECKDGPSACELIESLWLTVGGIRAARQEEKTDGE